MSSFNCNKCGTAIIDSERGYVTSCEHFKAEEVNKFRSKYIDTRCSCHAGKICELHEEEVMRNLNKFRSKYIDTRCSCHAGKIQVDIPKELKDVITNWSYENE